MSPLILLGYACAVLIGLSLGLLGGGGSILTVPVLHYVLGYEARTAAVPMSLVVVGVTSALGAVQHWRGGTVSLRTVLAFGPPAILGALLGALLAARMRDARVQLLLFGGVMVLAAVSMYFGRMIWTRDRAGAPSAKSASPQGDSPPTGSRPYPFITLVGAGVGLLTGFLGVGGGFLYVPSLVLLGGLPIKVAVGTSLPLILLSCIAGVLGYLGTAAFDWPALALFTAFALVGVMVGSRLVRRVPSERLRQGFAAFILVLGVLVLLRPR
jgi:uncharacterized membrane protein YfcA